MIKTGNLRVVFGDGEESLIGDGKGDAIEMRIHKAVKTRVTSEMSQEETRNFSSPNHAVMFVEQAMHSFVPEHLMTHNWPSINREHCWNKEWTGGVSFWHSYSICHTDSYCIITYYACYLLGFARRVCKISSFLFGARALGKCCSPGRFPLEQPAGSRNGPSRRLWSRQHPIAEVGHNLGHCFMTRGDVEVRPDITSLLYLVLDNKPKGQLRYFVG